MSQTAKDRLQPSLRIEPSLHPGSLCMDEPELGPYPVTAADADRNSWTEGEANAYIQHTSGMPSPDIVVAVEGSGQRLILNAAEARILGERLVSLADLSDRTQG